MTTVNMVQAKSQLSKLVEAVESGVEPEIIIARNSKPVARLTALATERAGKRIGSAEGEFEVPDNIDAMNEEVETLFYGRS